MKVHVLLCLCALNCWACGDDDSAASSGAGAAGKTGAAGLSAGAGNGAGAGGGGTSQAKNSCYANCDAQETVSGCEPFVSNQDCKLLCDGLVMGTPSECLDDFSAYYDCTVQDGFKCVGSLVASNTNACQDEQDALDACANGPGGTQCEGQNASGTCPQVACPCPEGTKMVSGFDTEGGKCKCLDQVTCKDLFCD